MAGPPVKASICADKILEELEKAEAQGLRVCAVRDKDVSVKSRIFCNFLQA